MSTYMHSELLLFLRAVGTGAFFLVCYDLLMGLRQVLPHGKLWISMEDFLYWIFCGADFFLLLHKSNRGILRGFVLAGALLGAWIYNRTLRRRLMRLWIILWGICVNPVKFLINWLIFCLKRCRISVYRFRKPIRKSGERHLFWFKRGRQIGKYKEGAKQKANRE
jgi:hypothetical protein